MSAPPAVTIPTRERSIVMRYLLANPVSVALTLATLITALAFGTLWGGFPEGMAAGPITTGQLAYWWTPITALMIPDSAVELVLTLLLALTAMAYAERLLGSWRTVLVFFIGGAASIFIGVGLEALAAQWGESWALLAQIDLVLDPPIGIFAVLLAASALAPVLWRRRIRIIGFSVLLMFALYAGDSDSAYRLIAGVVGLLIGLMFARGAARGAWRRSSFQETRTLVAAVVAVTGLGPLIVLLSGVDRGPLAIVVSGFAQVDADEVFERCAQDLSARCDTDIALALTTGTGPFLLSLVPLVLSLVAAWGLRRGRRAAWMLGLAVNAGIAVLSATSLGTADLLDPAVQAVSDIEFAISAVAATAIPIAVIVLLFVTARRFQVRAPRAAALRFAVTVAVTFVVLVLVYLLIALVSADDFAGASPGEALADVLRLFVPSGFLSGLTFVAPPFDGLGLIAYQWIGVGFWIVFIVALLLLYRATATGRTSVDEERFRALLKKGGGGTLGFMGTWPGNDYWFSEDGEAAVAYRVINGVALTMSDPVCADGCDAETIRAFVDHCDAQGWTTVFYSFHDRYLPVFESFGWQHMSVGEETVIDLPDLEIAGKPWQKVRQALNRGTREGMTTVWSTWEELPPALAGQIEAISEEWVSEKELPEMGFTLGGMDELKDDEVYLYLAVDPQGGVQAITSWLPSWTDGRVTGWTIDFMRRGDNSMNGIMEFIIASAALRMKEEGAEVLSLSGAPLATKPTDDGEVPEATVMTRLLGWLAGVLEPAYGFTSLFKFKSKFNPRYDTIHMAYADPAQLPAIGTAIGKAYLPEVSPREYIALVKTLAGGA